MSDKSETFSPFDAADYLSTFDDVAAYLEAVIDEGDDDPVLIAQALGAIARSGNVSELARRPCSVNDCCDISHSNNL